MIGFRAGWLYKVFLPADSFHHLRMMMDEYVWFAIETQFNNEKKLEARNTVLKHLSELVLL